jgi:hypothetical protein
MQGWPDSLKEEYQLLCHNCNNLESHKMYKHQRKDIKLWQDALKIFGPCKCCQDADINHLCIDHIHGGGNKLRKQEKHKEPTGKELLKKFEYMDWPENLKETYRLLCFNCNLSLGLRKYCPHQKEKENIEGSLEPS